MYCLTAIFLLLLYMGPVLALYPPLLFGANENVLNNSGFEKTGLFAPFAEWQDNSSWAEVNVAYERQVGRNGSGTAVRIVASHYRKGATQFVQPGVTVQKGQVYLTSIWMRGNLSQPVSVSLRERGTPYRTFASHSFRITNEWREYSFKAVSSDHSIDAHYMVRFEGNGELWLDDVQLTRDVGEARVSSSAEGNLITNGGFEVGGGRWGVLYREAGSPVMASAIEHQNPQPAMDSEDVFEGGLAMRVEVPEEASVTVSSAYFNAVPEKEYTLRVRLRADHPRKVRIGVAHGVFDNRSMRVPPATVDVGTDWKIYSLPVLLPQSTNDAYFVYVESSEAGTLWLDGVEFADDLAGDYRPAAHVEVGLLREDASAIIEVGAALSLKIIVAAHTGGPATLKLSLIDYEGRQRELLANTFTLDSGGRWNSEVSVPTEQPGYFRALAEVFVNGARVDADELAVAIVPRSLAPREDSPFGNHARFNSESLDLAQRMGVSWLRLHPPLTTKWYSVEPEAGKFQYFDSAILDANSRGLHILGSLDGTPRWASTAPPELTVHNNSGYTAYIPRDYAKWREYVYRTVKRYRGVIDYWEIWNEPSAHAFLKLPDGGGMKARAEAYMKLLRIAYTAAKEANPAAKIVAGCSTTVPPAEWFSLLFERGAYDFMDVASVHLYQDDVPEGPLGISTAESVSQLKSLMQRQDANRSPKPIWQTEVGIQHMESMYETRVNVDVRAPLTGTEGAEYIVKRHIDVLAAGIEKWFYYDMFWSKRPDRLDYTGLFEWDGSPRPSAAAYAVLAHMLRGLKLEEKDGGHDEQTVAARFVGDGRVVYVVWANKDSEQVAIPLADDEQIVAIYDIMGRSVVRPSSLVSPEVEVGLSPQYVFVKRVGDT